MNALQRSGQKVKSQGHDGMKHGGNNALWAETCSTIIQYNGGDA